MPSIAINFKTVASTISKDSLLIDKLWQEIETSYTSPGRHYHDISHLDNLVNELLPVKMHINNWATIVFSIAYHDIVYDPLRLDNEEESAKFATGRLQRLNFPPAQILKCAEQIIATKNHNAGSDDDTDYFTDADLSILGAPTDTYRKYAEAIRQEYQVYPDIIYYPGRTKVLHHFLAKPFIYKTDFFREKYENAARNNLKNELNKTGA